jgi:hypothetical protein
MPDMSTKHCPTCRRYPLTDNAEHARAAANARWRRPQKTDAHTEHQPISTKPSTPAADSALDFDPFASIARRAPRA